MRVSQSVRGLFTWPLPVTTQTSSNVRAMSRLERSASQDLSAVYTIYADAERRALGDDKRSVSADMSALATTTTIDTDGDGSCKARTRRREKIILAIDLFITLAVVLILLLIELDIIPHRRTGFYCKDPTLSFPYEGDSISTATLLLSVYIVPFIIIGSVEARREVRATLTRTWRWYREFLVASTALLAVVQCTKALTSSHRPHFLQTCRPIGLPTNCTVETWVSRYECLGGAEHPYLVADASRSFPSGHAALSVFAALFCAWYLERRMATVVAAPRLAKPLAQTALVVAAAWCSVSRVTDHRHHWWDVAFGVTLALALLPYAAFRLCRNFDPRLHLYTPPPQPHHHSHSTVTLLTTDTTNKNAASVIL